MENAFPAIALTIIILSLVIWWLFRARTRNARLLEEGTTTAFEAGLSTSGPVFSTETGSRAPVSEFTVRGGAIHVTFDVPLPEERDEVLEELLLAEAVEVVREKRHTLPLGDLEEIVVHAGRGDRVRDVGRVTLPAKGELPPPAPPRSTRTSRRRPRSTSGSTSRPTSFLRSDVSFGSPRAWRGGCGPSGWSRTRSTGLS